MSGVFGIYGCLNIQKLVA